MLPDVTVVVPTIGRPSFGRLLEAVAAQTALPAAVVVVDDRPRGGRALDVPAALADRTTVVRSAGRGPAAARNAGWTRAATPWVVFLDDDVVPAAGWSTTLAHDLHVAPTVGIVQGRVRVPRPNDRRLTDSEINTVALESAPWITADLAMRTEALHQLGGFDERFPRAYREDSDLALRAERAGWRLVTGNRITRHPLRDDPWWISVSAQRGNADDALMRVLHGTRWQPPRGRRRRHLAITAAGCGAVLTAVAGARRAAAVLSACWVAGTAELSAARIAAGSRRLGEAPALVVTSIAIPPVAAWHWIYGRLRWRRGATQAWPMVGSADGPRLV